MAIGKLGFPYFRYDNARYFVGEMALVLYFFCSLVYRAYASTFSEVHLTIEFVLRGQSQPKDPPSRSRRLIASALCSPGKHSLHGI